MFVCLFVCFFVCVCCVCVCVCGGGGEVGVYIFLCQTGRKVRNFYFFMSYRQKVRWMGKRGIFLI